MASGGFNQTLKWTLGLLNSANKYLTAETFQHKVTANGTALKKKQIWTLERVGESKVALKSHSNRFLSIDKDGKVSAAAEEIGADQTLELVTQEDGKVAILSSYGRYLGGSGDNISGFDKDIGSTNLFVIHLAMHPQINLRNVNRRTYCHYDETAQELCCNEEIPWGYDSLILLEFHEGKYALRAANNLLLSRTGKLVENLSGDTLFTIVFRGTQVAFKDGQNKYLTAVGASATLQTRKSTIGKDELFVLEDSHPQFQLVASNGKLVSIRDGLEVRANQREPTDTEIFQMEAVDRSDRSGNVKWAVHANNKKYWSSAPGLKADMDDHKDPSTHFEIEWRGPKIAIKSSAGKYVSVTSNGKMSADSAECAENCEFTFQFINRPLLILRGEYGFVGVKGGSGILECNRSQYDVFRVSCRDGTYNIQGADNKYMGIDGDGYVTINNDQPTDFRFELRAHTHMVIRAPNGNLLKGQQNGGFTPTGTGIASNTLWEY